MKLAVTHSTLGPGVLTTERAESSYGLPVFVADADDRAYGTQDAPGAYLTKPAGVKYTVEEDAWLRVFLDQPNNPFTWRWRAPGAGSKRAGEEACSEALSGRVTPSQMEKVSARGGWPWVRTLIDEAE